MVAEVAVGARGVALFAKGFRHVKHDRHGLGVVALRQIYQSLAGIGLHIRRVDNRQMPTRQTTGGNKMQGRKSILSCLKTILIV